MTEEKKMDRLDKIISIQREFHELVGPSLKSASEAECELMIVDNIKNLIFEGVEVTQELNFKPWKKQKKEVNWPKVKTELSDVFIFLLNAMLEAGMDADDLYQYVSRKQSKNFERQKNGY